MSVDWGRFLAGLEQHVRAKPSGATPGEVQPPGGWQPSPPATDAEIGALEARFGAPFPPSYVSFLRACNGLWLASHPIGRFLGGAEVSWFRKNHNDWIRAYISVQDPEADREPDDEEYYGYADNVRPLFRPRHFRLTIQITAVGDAAVYLLNPQAVWPSGEWEAWFLANWNPGVERYRSFAELMWEQYGSQMGLTAEQFGLPHEDVPPTTYLDPPGKPGRRVRTPPKPPRPFGRIARDVRDGDLPQLQRALKELARLATPEAIDLLEQVCKHPVEFVRWDARDALKKARRKSGEGGGGR
jgi:hypothetical protein